MANGKRTLFLYYDPHYFHASLAKTIGAVPWQAPKIRSSGGTANMIGDLASSIAAVFTLPKDYDVYFCEGTYLFPALAKKMGLLKKDAKIINIVSSPLFYYLKIGKIKGPKRTLAISLLKYVDGFVCVGKMEQELLKHFHPRAKTIVIYPFIREEIEKEIISGARPNLSSNKVLFVGNRDTFYKGTDLLVHAFRKAQKEIPDLELTILGDYDTDVVGPDKKNIHTPGHIKDTPKYFKDASLYAHFGRGEAFGVAVMEAMLAGVPTMVSDATGAKELVQKISSSMVIPLDKDKAAAAIIRYFKLTQKQKLALAKKANGLVIKYKEKAVLSDFKRKYQSLLE